MKKERYEITEIEIIEFSMDDVILGSREEDETPFNPAHINNSGSIL